MGDLLCGSPSSGENKGVRKRLIDSSQGDTSPRSDTWLDLEQIATIEVTSEDPNFPVESVFRPDDNAGWRAAQDGEQVLRIIFDEPTTLHHIQLQFGESEFQRTQEFTICWSSAQGGPAREIVRQQWTFSPDGSIRELEHYDVSLEGVAILELRIKPDLSAGRGRATLLKWRVGR
jgi:hypothetical protein